MSRQRRRSSGGIGLALAGGGPGGAVYEIGALRAIEEAVEGLNLNDLTIYVGVSAGGFVGACLANELSTEQLCRTLIKTPPGEPPFEPELFLTPAFRRIASRGAALPRLVVDAVLSYVSNPVDHTFLGSMARLARSMPIGLFDNEKIREYCADLFTSGGRTDDFRRLPRKLVIVASELCTGRAVRFTARSMSHVPISRAVQASTALPGLYPPVCIDNRYYVDGVLLKTVHASVALDAGCDLVICVNPIVPVNALGLGESLVARGLPVVLSQTFRTLIHSRMEVGMAQYRTRYKGQDVLLFEPSRDDYDMFFSNIFSFASRKRMVEHAYRTTRAELLARADRLAPVFARQGMRLRTELLEDQEREVWAGVDLQLPPRQSRLSGKLNVTLQRLEDMVATEEQLRA